MTYDELRLQQLLGPFNRPQGIATLNPLAFQYQDQLYPDLQSTDVGYSIAPPGSADEGYAIGPSGTADDLISTGFYGSPDVGFPFAPANRLGGLDLPRFEGVSQLGRQDEDVEQVESLVEEEPSGIAKLFQNIKDIYNKLPTPMNLIRGFAERVGEPSRYSRFSPGGTFRGGIYNVGGVNTPFQLVNDFYDRTTGLNRFDRAAQRFARTGKTSDLFASSRTLADFVRKKREVDAAKRAASAPVSSASTSGGGEGRGPSGMSSALGGVYGGGAGGLHSDY
jgi:hypothetical protein